MEKLNTLAKFFLATAMIYVGLTMSAFLFEAASYADFEKVSLMDTIRLAFSIAFGGAIAIAGALMMANIVQKKKQA